MFRSFFLYLSKAAWARQVVTGWPVMRRMAGRFIAGDSLADALRVIGELNARGIHATLDHLGENTTTPDESRQAVQDILMALDGIASAGVRANVSIKLTQIGLRLEPGLCAENLLQIVRRAAEQGNFVRVDMEDSPTTQVTLDLVKGIRSQGLTNLGVVIQSYLFRSQADLMALVAAGVPVRLCKGAYREPASVAFPRKADVDLSYDRLAALLLDASKQQGSALSDAAQSSGAGQSSDGKIPPLPALATHDAQRIEFAKAQAARIALPKSGLEFQMLYGIRRDLQEQLAADGYPVRVYVPYGTQWYPYFMRRLGERPANVWFIVSNLFRR